MFLPSDHFTYKALNRPPRLICMYNLLGNRSNQNDLNKLS